MRFTGVLVRWDDVRGIGYIESTQGGEPLFVHISALPAARRRPREGDRYSFEIEPSPKGGKRAVRVESLAQPAAPIRRTSPQRRDTRRPVWVAAIVLLGVSGLLAFRFNASWRAEAADASPPDAVVPVAESRLPAPAPYRCDGRQHCTQMRSCDEARYFLAHCPDVKMDGDGDGVPCEEQHCTGLLAR